MITLTATAPDPLSRSTPSDRPPLRVGLVQHRWRPDARELANGINSGLFMVVPNRTGDEGALSFYGSSFISDPYGRVLVAAPRDEEAVLIADLDLDQRRDWLELFPFLLTRRPDSYAALTAPVDAERPFGAGHAATAVIK